MINIYPINFYILYAAIAILVIALLITLIKVMKMGKSLKAMNLETTAIKDNLANMQFKTKIINETREEKKKKTAWLKTALPIALAIQAIYRNNDDMVGVKGYTSAAKVYFKNTQAEQKIIRRVNRALLKK